jgi:hypothetical protein
MAKASIAYSEYHTMEAFGRALGTQARLGVGHDLLNVFGDVIGILLCKIVSKNKGEHIRTQQIQPHPRRGLSAESCIRYNKDQVKVHFANIHMQGFISKRFFTNHFYDPSDSTVLGKPLWIYRTSRPS